MTLILKVFNSSSKTPSENFQGASSKVKLFQNAFSLHKSRAYACREGIYRQLVRQNYSYVTIPAYGEYKLITGYLGSYQTFRGLNCKEKCVLIIVHLARVSR